MREIERAYQRARTPILHIGQKSTTSGKRQNTDMSPALYSTPQPRHQVHSPPKYHLVLSFQSVRKEAQK